LTARLAEAIDDQRHPADITPPRRALIAQRIFQIGGGYKDGNDANARRTDPGRPGRPVPTVKGSIRPRRLRRQPLLAAESPLNPTKIVGFWTCPQVYEISGLKHFHGCCLES
jgi:hypothetical protein